jgi:hypothetical protein
MRGLRSFLGLLAILIALGAYLYFVESKRTPGDDTETKPDVFAVEAETIDEVTIRSEAGDTTTVRKSNDEWTVTAPAPAPADSGEISSITRSLASLEEGRVIDENPSTLADFGLESPRIEIAFKSGGSDHGLLIGARTPTGADIYAKTAASPKVFLIASYLDSTFNRSTFDLRDKSALRFDRDAADSMALVTDGRTIRFQKSGGTWQLAETAATRSDEAAIEGLLAQLDGLQMRGVVAPEADNPAKFGLDTPAATVRIGSGSSSAELQVGSPAEEGQLYARDAARPEIFTIDASLLDDLKKDAGEYRQKDLNDARAFNTTRIEITRGAGTVTFEKTAGKDAEGKEEVKWRRVAPSAGDVDAAQLESLLSALTSARATAFVDKLPAGASQQAAFALQFDEGRGNERVTFYQSGDEAYALREGSQPAHIDASVLSDITRALGELEPAQ